MDIITTIELRIEIIPVVGTTRMTRKGLGLKIMVFLRGTVPGGNGAAVKAIPR